MINTGIKETGDCINCSGTGIFDVTEHCPSAGCDHKHEEPTRCDSCSGTGQCEYDQYEYDPNCEFCRDRRAHPVWFFLPEVRCVRGGIKFS